MAGEAEAERIATGSPGPRRTRIYLLVICAFFALHIWTTRFCGDDGAILWRYAKHFAEGDGFRYNVEDAPIEGCSNLPFAVVMSAAWLSGIDPEVFTVGIGLALGLTALLLAHGLALRAGLPPPLALLCTAFLAANHSFAAWSTGGMGTKLYTVFVLLALLRFLYEERHRDAPWLRSALLFGAVAVIRPEGATFFALALAWRLPRWRSARRALALFCGTFLLIKGAQVGFELLYFGSPLPNTYYAKVNGLWFSRGLWFLGRFALVYSAWIVLPLAFLGCRRGSGHEPRPLRALLFFTLGFACALAAIGGDRFEFRILDPVLAPLAICAFGGVARLASSPLRRVHLLAAPAVLALLAASLGGSFLRRLDGIFNKDFVSTESIADFYSEQKRCGLLLRKHLPPGTRLALGAAGALPLYSGFYVLDTQGLNDRIIARRPILERTILGHERCALPEDYDRARVDYVNIQILWRHPLLELAAWSGVPAAAIKKLECSLQRHPDDILPPLLARLKDLGEHHLCVRLEDSAYLLGETRTSAEPYRRFFRERGYDVLF